MFIIVSGVSGSGKQTVIDYVTKTYKNAQFFLSCTTRAPRSENENLYHYLSEEEFASRKANNEFFETENVHGFNYGVLKSSLDEIIANKDKIYLKDVDVHGAEKLYNFLKGKAEVLWIFMDVPDEILRERLKARGESPDRIEVRLSRGKMEREYKDKCDYVIINTDRPTTFKEVDKILAKSVKNKKILQKR